MELYLKQNKFSANTKLYFYDQQDNLCYQTMNGLNNAKKGIQITDDCSHSLIEVIQEKKVFQTNNYYIKFKNGGYLTVKDNSFFRKDYQVSDKMITFEKTKRKTYLLKFADMPLMEYATKKAKHSNYTKLSIFEEKYLPLALAFSTTACAIQYQEDIIDTALVAALTF